MFSFCRRQSVCDWRDFSESKLSPRSHEVRLGAKLVAEIRGTTARRTHDNHAGARSIRRNDKKSHRHVSTATVVTCTAWFVFYTCCICFSEICEWCLHSVLLWHEFLPVSKKQKLNIVTRLCNNENILYYFMRCCILNRSIKMKFYIIYERLNNLKIISLAKFMKKWSIPTVNIQRNSVIFIP